MAGWISSKLKVAENLLQQIDQQAAESLRKNDRSLSPERRDVDDDGVSKKDTPSSSSNASTTSDVTPLKLQLNKKPTRPSLPQGPTRLSFDPAQDPIRIVQDKAPDPAARVPAKSVANVEDDWTELLAAAPSRTRSGGAVLERKRSGRRLGVVERKVRAAGADGNTRKVNSPLSDGSESAKGGVTDRDSPGIGEGRMTLDAAVSGEGSGDAERVADVVKVDVVGSGAGSSSGLVSREEDVNAGEVENVKGEIDGGAGDIRKSEEMYRTSITVGSSAPYDSSGSSDRSDSESESDSSTNSENERESREERRRRRERMIAEKLAALAAEAIRERENAVARLEGEKQSLEKILEERKKQQAEEASELQTSMMETMEAVDLEKQRHNSTRMEILARVAALENTNAELSKSLATTQWNLEIEVNRVVDLRQQIEFKKFSHEGLKRKMEEIQRSSSHKKETMKDEQGMLEAEYSFLCDKILQLKEKARKIEDNIEMAKKEMLQPTQEEVELKGRLDQLTDRLIQKQTQVETLSAEKAMLLIKLETVSRYLHDGGLTLNSDDVAVDLGAPSGMIDVEAGSRYPLSTSAAARISRIRAAESHVLSFLRQMDSLFSVGALFLRRNPNARIWAAIYLLLLHFWFFYVFSSSKPADTSRSGALFSLENINKTGP